MSEKTHIRKAHVKEVPEIWRMLHNFAEKDQDVLPRTMADLYSYLRDYFVYQHDEGPIVGIAALHLFWDNLAEIRSLVVQPEFQKSGIGTQLLEKCLEEARSLRIASVFVLISEKNANFFARFGFRTIQKEKLPVIVWAECVHCLKYPDCDEFPMLLELESGA
jgi:amino-acid N-acetyltransferase